MLSKADCNKALNESRPDKVEYRTLISLDDNSKLQVLCNSVFIKVFWNQKSALFCSFVCCKQKVSVKDQVCFFFNVMNWLYCVAIRLHKSINLKSGKWECYLMFLPCIIDFRWVVHALWKLHDQHFWQRCLSFLQKSVILTCTEEGLKGLWWQGLSLLLMVSKGETQGWWRLEVKR